MDLLVIFGASHRHGLARQGRRSLLGRGLQMDRVDRAAVDPTDRLLAIAGPLDRINFLDRQGRTGLVRMDRLSALDLHTGRWVPMGRCMDLLILWTGEN